MASVNVARIERVALKIKELSVAGTALTFTDENQFPPVASLGILDYIPAVTMHDYGFWIGDEKGYVEPLYGEVDGGRLKGADLLWTLSMRVYREKGPEFFKPGNLARLSFDEFCQWLPEKYGFQDLYVRWRMTQLYGTYSSCITNSADFVTLLAIANFSTQPLHSFIKFTFVLPGYNQDPLFKKNLLLAMILANRPEKFLRINLNEKWLPIVDYHLMRVSERLGIVDLNPEEYQMLSKRVWVSREIEASVREAVYDAVTMLIELSGKPMSEIDFLLWSARRYCPEMTTPDCPKCIFDGVCAKRIELFQPVFRTTNY